jgi:hypothetical protein
MINYAMNEQKKAIGPVPVTSALPDTDVSPDEPFKVDRNDPDQQALAKIVGWKRLEEIEKVDSQKTDLQRSPFPPGGRVSPATIKPRHPSSIR